MKKVFPLFRRPYLKVPLIYLLISVVWIIGSDIISFSDELILSAEVIQTIKGLFFIFATAFLIYYLIKKDYKAIEYNKKALIQSLDYYLQILDKFPNPVWKTNSQGRFDYHNSAWYSFMRVSEKSGYSQIEEFIFAEDVHRISEYYRNKIEAREVISLEYRILDKEGNVHWIKDYGTPLYNANNEYLGYIGSYTEITDLIEANKEIVKREELLSLALDATNDAVWDWDLDSEFIYWSPRAYIMLGYEPDEFAITFNKWQELLHQDDRESTWQSIQQQIRSDDHKFSVDFRYKCKDGTFKWIRGRGKVVEFKANGDIKRFTGTHVDIDDRKKIEIELHANRDLLHSILDSSPLPIISLSLEGKIQTYNISAEKVFGWNRSEVIGGLNPIIPFEYKREYTELINRVLDGENLEGIEVFRQTKSGEILDLSVFTGPLRDENGNVNGVMAIFEDITERKKALSLIKESEEQFRHVLNSVHLVAVMLNGEGRITFCNKYLLELTGWKYEEVINEKWIDLFIPEEGRESIQVVFTHTIKSGEFPTFYENEILTRTGECKMIAWNNILTRNSEEEIVGVTSIGQDITDKIVAERELKESREKYKTVADYTFDWEYWLNENWQYNYISPSCEDITGYSPETFLADPDFTVKIVHPDHREIFKKHFYRDLKSPDSECTLEFRIVTKHNTIKWISHHCKPIINSDGKYLGRRGTNRDITDIKMALQSLMESEAKYRSLYNSMNEGFALHDIVYDENKVAFDYVITNVNPSYEKIVGIKRDQCINKRATELYGTGSPPYFDIYNRVAETGNPEFFETYFEPMDQYFSISVFSPERGKFATIFEDITKRKKAELRVKESEEQFRSIVQNSDAVFFRIDKEGIFTLSDGKALKMLGLRPGQVVGASAFEVYKDYPDIISQIHRCLAGENVNAIIDVGGIIFEIFYNPQRNDSGDVTGLYGIAFDITGRKKQEENIKILSQAVDQSQVSIVITDIEGRVEYINPKFTQVSGFELNEVMGKKTNFLKSGKTPQSTYEELWETILSGYEWQGNFYNKRKNGELFWESVSISPIKDEKGQIIHFVGVKEDITDKVKAQEELDSYRQNLERLVKERTEELDSQYNFLRTLIDTIPNPVFVKNTDGKYTDINTAFEKYYGVSKQEVIGKGVDLIAPDDVIKSTNAIDKELLNKTGTKIYETYHIKKSGEKRNLLVYKATFGRNKSRPEGVAGLVIDITDQKQLEEKTKNALEREKELNQMKTSFISMASHEFRTPLTSILASADLLGMYVKGLNDPKYDSNICRIQKSVADMVELLDDVLTLSRTDRGKINFNPSRVNMLPLIDSMISGIELNTQNSHKIIKDIRLSKPIINLDEKLFKHILDNLINNSIKFSPKGSEIYICIEDISNKLKIEVKDAGLGIPEKDLKYIFDPFYRSENVSNIKGTGLGLSIVQKFVEIHKGSIKVDSEMDKGTKFIVELMIPQEF